MVVQEGEDDDNPYLAMRAAKIARNKAKLAQLGLGKGKSPATPSAELVAAREKRRLASLEPPQRRSLRIRYSVEAGGEGEIEAVEETKDGTSPLAPTVFFGSEKLGAEHEVTLPIAPLPKVSARSIQLDNEKVVSSCLGVTFQTTGKAHCMQECAKLALPEPVLNPISFNKYSGIQEWQNCVFLWVNLHVEGSQNKFLPEHRITFYGGKQMVDESPIIQRLKAAAASFPTFMVILWCREYNPERKTYFPYFCMGRLSVRCCEEVHAALSPHRISSINVFVLQISQLHSYDPNTRPIEFVWNLDDSENLLTHADPDVRKYMHQLISVR